jgi:2-polyprenyl-3-methyl-5-hydroxy-6-metoxy-1,4-benzoquinol methylase
VREDAERWDARYSGGATGVPSPPTGLDGIALPEAHGRCLDVACGLGEQSLWAAALGFDVVAFDVSPTAIGALRAAAAARRLDARIDAHVVDLDDGLPADVGGGYALVICQRFRDPRLYAALAGAATPGGLIVITVLSQVGAQSPGPHHAPVGELVDAFRALDVEIVRTGEGNGEATLVARRPSQRMQT